MFFAVICYATNESVILYEKKERLFQINHINIDFRGYRLLSDKIKKFKAIYSLRILNASKVTLVEFRW